jgi:hypothetical protein
MTGRVCEKSPSHGYAPDGVCKWCEEQDAAPATILDHPPKLPPHTSARELAQALSRPNPLLVDKLYEEPAAQARDASADTFGESPVASALSVLHAIKEYERILGPIVTCPKCGSPSYRDSPCPWTKP